MRRTIALAVLVCAALPASASAGPTSDSGQRHRALCDENGSLCTETVEPVTYEGNYIGHDEPAVLFYSNKPGSGNSNTYTLQLPKDPPTPPTQDGTGGTPSFMLHPAFWFGMALCDPESAPEYTKTCTPNSDTNIANSADPAAPDYIGHHSGTAFMEMQFYPPGFVSWPAGDSCDATKWCAAMNIDSLSIDYNNGINNNADCLGKVGVEPVNFAFITKTGVAHAPANPLAAFAPPFDAITPNPKTDLFMSSGDVLKVYMYDTAGGFRVVIRDLTTGTSGSMTASRRNGFGRVRFEPNATSCSVEPASFHPMYSTSSEQTRVPWAAHSYNISFSDEIGHFEYCSSADPATGNCTASSQPGEPDADDNVCFNPSDSTLYLIGGCLGTDTDFDGPEYGFNWPGSRASHAENAAFNSTPIRFTSPKFNHSSQNYDRVGFETDLPRIEAPDVGGICNRTTGEGCTNPPPGAAFYPIFTTNHDEIRFDGCFWQLGGTHIDGTANTFGGTSTAEYGPLLQLAYPSVGGPVLRYNDFRNVLPNNPCRA